MHEDEVFRRAHSHGAVVASCFVKVITDDDEVFKIAELLHPFVEAAVRRAIFAYNDFLDGWVSLKSGGDFFDVGLVVEGLNYGTYSGGLMRLVDVWLPTAAA